jgi:hypothetical protein
MLHCRTHPTGKLRRRPRARPHTTHAESRGSKATAFASVMCHRCEQPLRVVLPAHRLGDRAGRSPGSRVIACRPAFPVSQWLTRTKALRLQLRGQPRLHLFVTDDPCSLLPPRCDPRNQHDGKFARLSASVKIGSRYAAPTDAQ